jgi:hypothetical protein
MALIFGKVDDGGDYYACFKGGRSALIASGLRVAEQETGLRIRQSV